ncbi:MAG: DUF3320 domain-containing protein [Acetobacteraceae bacterium]
MSDEELSARAEGQFQIEIKVSIAARINVAFHQNAVPAVAEITLVNETDSSVNEVTVSVSATPEFLRPATFRLDGLRPRGTARICPVLTELDAAFLLNLTEAVRCEITVTASADGVVLASVRSPCELLSPSEWTGLVTAPELIAAFVRPNDPSIDSILRNAAEKLRRAGRDPSLDGYRSRNTKLRTWEVAGAVWAALSDEHIVYALPPRSFERNGQKVRLPSAILERKIGTCLDLTLLIAAALEQAGLNPIVCFYEGHACAGIWLADDEFSGGTIDEPQTLRKRIKLQELALIETTLLTSQPPIGFRAAVEKAEELVAEGSDNPFQLAVDIRQARRRQIKPLAVGMDSAAAAAAVVRTAGATSMLEEPPTFIEDEAPVEPPTKTTDRLERWKRKLLDLSLRNRLLNFKPTKSAVGLICPNPAALEAILASGKAIKLLPAAAVMTGADPRNAELFFRTEGDDAAKRYATEALERGEVLTNLADGDLEDQLTGIYRAARSSFEEDGANSLYLAVGFVSWPPQGKQRACRAPLLLVPVSLDRKSIRSGFRLVLHDDEPRINPTLLEMMRQDFNLAIPEFERELPTSTSGLDIDRIWRIARSNFKDVHGFELTEDVVLSNFSFAKYLIWKDLVDRTDILKRNPIVKHLIDAPKESYGDGGSLPDERRLDEDVHPRDLFLCLPADSSQTAAVVAADEAKDFVLFGPPGTGKSQTIANIISQLLAHGKTVLFVSAKATALEVVRRRLDAIGLGSFCLEVHSAKAQKTAVLSQLRNAWEARAAPAATAWEGATSDLKTLRDQLNSLVLALHRRHRNGLTAHQALGRVVAGRAMLPGFAISYPTPDQHDEGDMARLRQACDTIRIAMENVGDPARHPLRGIGRTHWSPLWQRDLATAARTFEGSARELAGAAAALAAIFDAPADGDPDRCRDLLAFAAQVLKKEAPAAAPLLTIDCTEIGHAFAAWKEINDHCKETARDLSCRYRDSVFDLDLRQLRDDWHQASSAGFLTRRARTRRVRDTLAPFTTGTVPQDAGGEIGKLVELKTQRERAQQYDPVLKELGSVWHGSSTEPDTIDAILSWRADTIAAASRLARNGRPASAWLQSLASMVGPHEDAAAAEAFRMALGRTVGAYQSFDNARQALITLAEPPDEWLGLPRSDGFLTEAQDTAHKWQTHATDLARWCTWQEAAATANISGLAPLVAALTSGALAPGQVGYAFEVGYARWWIDQIVEREETLRSFVAEQHSNKVARFQELDGKVAELAKLVVSGRLMGNIPARHAFGKDQEFGRLAHELEKKARYKPLRQLFAQIPMALAKLAPCMMMSPLSVAQYLPAEAVPFDVVLFDEASQLPVWDAIGAIARGKQAIIAGDPKQLPPTAFFDRSSDDYDDIADLEDLESILDECLAANVPQKRLAWHYRSRHESLIAFSNERYYDGRLVTFPSPVTDDRAVRYVHVPGGVYERGSARVNREEARAVVREVVHRLTDPGFGRDLSSLGIVTLNAEQQHLIETMLDQERRNRPELERFFGRDWHEPVFVKNLESVQGDERDVIFLSVAYGPDAAGRVSHNFGPLNKDSGARRLNVAITRARSELVVFATLAPDQVDLSRTKSAGARDFKHFLEYAERGARALAVATAPSGRDTESPLEEAVQRALEAHGWTVHPQVGVAGYRIDFGIVHPDAPGRYLAGVECDGATYHRSATARDRDIARERVLRDLGWTIHRVWSTDWWIDTERAITTLCSALDSDLAADRQEAAAMTSVTTPQSGPVAPMPAETLPAAAPEEQEGSTPLAEADATATDKPTPGDASRSTFEAAHGGQADSTGSSDGEYHVADLVAAGFSPDRNAFYETAYRPTLRRMAAHVIAAEGPIFEDLLVHRIARAHAFGRAAGRIRETILAVVEGRFPRSVEDGRKIFWPAGSDTQRPPVFRTGSPDDRNHTEIPMVELASLARRFSGAGAGEEDVATLMARELGLGRLREGTRNRLIRAARMVQGILS